MIRTLALSALVLVLALAFVGLGWLLGRAPNGGVSSADLARESATLQRHLDTRADELSNRLDVRADRIEQKLDILLSIATNVPPDLRAVR